MGAFLLFSLLPLAVALSIPGQNLILLDLNATKLDQMFTSNHTTSLLNATSLTVGTVVKCDSFRAASVDYDSCRNAWRKIPMFSDPDEDIEFRHRHHGPPPGKV